MTAPQAGTLAQRLKEMIATYKYLFDTHKELLRDAAGALAARDATAGRPQETEVYLETYEHESGEILTRRVHRPVPRPGAALGLEWLTPEVAAKAVTAYDDEYRRHRRSEYADFCRARATDAMRAVLLHAAQQGGT